MDVNNSIRIEELIQERKLQLELLLQSKRNQVRFNK